MPAGSSRGERLDPFTLPLRFAASRHGRRRRTCAWSNSTRERVVLRRAVRGIKMAVNLPVAAYLGVAIRMEPPEDDTRRRGPIVLEHARPAAVASALSRRRRHRHRGGMAVVGARARRAALVAEADGRLREPFERHRRACASRTPIAAPPPALRAQDSGGRRFRCGGGRARCRRRPTCIATSARSSRAIEPSFYLATPAIGTGLTPITRRKRRLNVDRSFESNIERDGRDGLGRAAQPQRRAMEPGAQDVRGAASCRPFDERCAGNDTGSLTLRAPGGLAQAARWPPPRSGVTHRSAPLVAPARRTARRRPYLRVSTPRRRRGEVPALPAPLGRHHPAPPPRRRAMA